MVEGTELSYAVYFFITNTGADDEDTKVRSVCVVCMYVYICILLLLLLLLPPLLLLSMPCFYCCITIII